MGGGRETLTRDQPAEQEGEAEDDQGDREQQAVLHPPRHPHLPAEAPGEGDGLQGREPDGGGQPGHRVRADADVAARPPDHHQHGAQHDAAEHGGGGPHHQPCHDLSTVKHCDSLPFIYIYFIFHVIVLLKLNLFISLKLHCEKLLLTIGLQCIFKLNLSTHPRLPILSKSALRESYL